MSDRVIETVGVGRVAVVATRLRVTLGVEVHGATPAEAVAGLWRDLDALQRVLDAQAVAPADRQTAGLALYEHHRNDGTPDGYQATCQVTATLADGAGAAAGIDAAITGVGDTIRLRGTDWVGEPTPDQVAEARRAAVSGALEQARQLAEAAGVRLGRLRSLREGSARGSGPTPMPRMALVAAARVPELEPGQTALSVVVEAVHDIE